MYVCCFILRDSEVNFLNFNTPFHKYVTLLNALILNNDFSHPKLCLGLSMAA